MRFPFWVQCIDCNRFWAKHRNETIATALNAIISQSRPLSSLIHSYSSVRTNVCHSSPLFLIIKHLIWIMRSTITNIVGFGHTLTPSLIVWLGRSQVAILTGKQQRRPCIPPSIQSYSQKYCATYIAVWWPALSWGLPFIYWTYSTSIKIPRRPFRPRSQLMASLADEVI